MDLQLAPRFPSRVMTPNVTYDTVKVALVDGWLYVWGLDTDFRPALVASAQMVPPAPESAEVLRFTTVDGESWVVAPAHDCGCGNPLKRTNLGDLLATLTPTS